MPNFLVLFLSDVSINIKEGKEQDDKAGIQEKKDLSHNDQVSVLKGSESRKDYLSLFLAWMQKETEAQRLIGGGGLQEPSPLTQVRIKYHDFPDAELRQQVERLNANTIPEAKDIKYPSPLTSIIRGTLEGATSGLKAYYIIKRDNLDEVVEWAQSAPIFVDGLIFEIRQLEEDLVYDEAKDFAVEQVVAAREKLMQEGKLKKDADGTYWTKIEIEDKELARKVEEAEKHSKILNS